MSSQVSLAAGTGSSVVVDHCQVCGDGHLKNILFLGYLPPVNQMRKIGSPPSEQPAYPANLLLCPTCQLVQLGLTVDKNILFPPEYPYTSGTTKILRENFAEMYQEAAPLLGLGPKDLIVDVGSNDGTLLSNFATAHPVQGIEPSQVGKLAIEKGIPTHIGFLERDLAQKVRTERGPATVVTATNVFAHIEDVHGVLDNILLMLGDKGVFISESHYLIGLLETLQYDTIYHEHLRYYSLRSLQYLLEKHGLEIIHAKRIPTHGGSIRVYAARNGARPVQASVAALQQAEAAYWQDGAALVDFKSRAVLSKLRLHAVLKDIKEKGGRIYAIGAPSRASTLIQYVGLDDGIIDCVLEVAGSLKVGKYMPGTLIPVLEESRLYEDQPEYALLLSWHIADELIPKITAKGFRGKYIVPLPDPRIVESRTNGG